MYTDKNKRPTFIIAEFDYGENAYKVNELGEEVEIPNSSVVYFVCHPKWEPWDLNEVGTRIIYHSLPLHFRSEGMWVADTDNIIGEQFYCRQEAVRWAKDHFEGETKGE